MYRKAVTLRDVAEHAQVSVSTASQILKGNVQYVGQDKRWRVFEAAKELHYRPNAIARSMVKRQTTSIGLINSIVAKDAVFISVIGGVQEVLADAGYHILLAHASDLEQETKAIEMLLAQQVSGLIFMSRSICQPIDYLLRLKEEGVPFVVINPGFDGNQDINQVRFNDWEAGYLATKHLLNLGHTRIAAICGPLHHLPPWRSAIDRLAGWRYALEERGIPDLPEWTIESDYTYEGGYKAARGLLKQPDKPTALVVMNDCMVIGVLRAFHYAKVKTPQQIALVSIGDPPAAAHTAPALTALAHPVPKAVSIAANLLLKQFSADTVHETENIMLSFNLHIRESCGTTEEPWEDVYAD